MCVCFTLPARFFSSFSHSIPSASFAASCVTSSAFIVCSPFEFGSYEKAQASDYIQPGPTANIKRLANVRAASIPLIIIISHFMRIFFFFHINIVLNKNRPINTQRAMKRGVRAAIVWTRLRTNGPSAFEILRTRHTLLFIWKIFQQGSFFVCCAKFNILFFLFVGRRLRNWNDFVGFVCSFLSSLALFIPFLSLVVFLCDARSQFDFCLFVQISWFKSQMRRSIH